MFETDLKKIQAAGLYRNLKKIDSKNQGVMFIADKKYIDFSTNDYLGHSMHPKVIEKSRQLLEQFGAGAGAARLMSGNYSIYEELETALAKLFKKQSALIFGSGFLTNSTVIPILAVKDDLIIADKLVHSSIIHGIQASSAKLIRFKHNDINALEKILKTERLKYNKCFIITESVFSMDGDICNLKEIIELKDKYNAFIYLDESHSFGLFGNNGAGLAVSKNLADRIDIIMATFSKAVGSYGGFIAAQKSVCEYLINRCRGFIFSTALPPAILGAALASINLFAEEPFRRKKLMESTEYARAKLKEKNINALGESQIIPILIGEAEKTVAISNTLEQNGYFVIPVRPPTVAVNSSRLRISINYNHEKKDIDNLINILKEKLLYGN